jgi:hypothetical protein
MNNHPKKIKKGRIKKRENKKKGRIKKKGE